MIFYQYIRKATQHKKIKASVLFVAVSLLVSLSGCQSLPNNQQTNNSIACNLSQSNNLEQAIRQSKKILTQLHCQSGFNAHFERLMLIASGTPDNRNLEKLAHFSRWGAKKGIISKKQSEETLRRYFTPKLVSLDYHSDFNTYSHCSMSQQLPEMQSMLNHELEQKQLGLTEVLGDANSYRQAVKEFQALNLLLEYTSSACQES